MAITRYVGLGCEVITFGSGEAAQQYIRTTERIEPDQGWIIPAPIAQRAAKQKNLGPFRGRGPIGPFDVKPENIGELLFGVLGDVATTNPDTGVYLHTFKGAESLKGYTVRCGVGFKERILPGCLFNDLTLSFTHGQNVKATSTVFGPSTAIESHGALATLAQSDFCNLDPFLVGGDPTNNFAKIATVDKKAYVYDGFIKIENNIPYDKGTLESRFFPSIKVGSRKVTGQISLYFTETDSYDKFLAGTEFDLDLKFNTAIITGSYRYYLQMILYNCVYLRNAAPHVIPMDEPLRILDAPFQAFHETTPDSEIEVKLQNTVSTIPRV